MKALLQRVKKAAVTINGQEKREIGHGLVILLGVTQQDKPEMSQKLAEKCASLRIFDDECGKLNLCCADILGSALVVSQFTLCADTKKGRRPSFIAAAKPPLSVDCYNQFVKCIGEQGLKDVQTGQFGADMQIELVNDGPVTIMLDTDDWK